MDDCSQKLKNFLDYVDGKTVTGDPYIDKLDQAVRQAKQNKEWRRIYMRMSLVEMDGYARGTLDGIEQGVNQTIAITKMLKSGEPETEIMRKTGCDAETIRQVKENLLAPV